MESENSPDLKLASRGEGQIFLPRFGQSSDTQLSTIFFWGGVPSALTQFISLERTISLTETCPDEYTHFAFLHAMG